MSHPVRTELVEVLHFSSGQEGQGFDKLSPSGSTGA